MKNNGKELEKLVKQFFEEIFEEIGLHIIKNRQQKGGSQYGFDNFILLNNNGLEKRIFIECKDYKSNVDFGQLLVKCYQLENNCEELSGSDIHLFISPKSNFSNEFLPEKNEKKLNQLFTQKIVLFEESNKINEIFALIPAVHRKIYGDDLPIIDRKKQINILLKLFESKDVYFRNNFPQDNERKFFLKGSQKFEKKFIKIKVGEERTDESRKLFWKLVNDNEEQNTLLNQVLNLRKIKERGLVLLGNPGSGKSFEIQQLANELWNKRIQYRTSPFYKSLSTYTANSRIEDYLPPNFKNYSNLTVLWDGLDETKYVVEFKAKFQEFLNNLESNDNINFVLGCRTNIYDSSVHNISDFKEIYILDIDKASAIDYLIKFCGLKQKDLSHIYFDKIVEFFNNPFYLKVFGEIYQKNKEIPKNRYHLIRELVNKRNNVDVQNKFQFQSYDIDDVEYWHKKVSIIMEAMQVNEISSEKLKSILGKDKKSFTESSFIEKQIDTQEWKYQHRIFQEFFVAKTLKGFDFEEIIEFISIDKKTKKTHPSWKNSISLLIQGLNGNKLKELLKWLDENQPEMLFDADIDRLSLEVRDRVFQSFFNKYSVESTLWLNNRNITKSLYHFADTKNNVDYLIKIIGNKEYHRRTRISAFEFLHNLDFIERKEEIKELFINLLSANSTDIDERFKTDLLHAFHNYEFYEVDYLKRVIKALGENDYHTIQSALLSLIKKSNADDFFNYIVNNYQKIIGIAKRKYEKKDNLMTSIHSHLSDVLTSFENPDYLIFGLSLFYEQRHSFLHFFGEKEDVEKIVDKLINLFQNSEKEIYTAVLNFIAKDCSDIDFEFFIKENNVLRFFNETGTRKKAFIDILELNVKIVDKRVWLVELFSKDEIKILVQHFEEENQDFDELAKFRNNLSWRDRDLSKELEQYVLDNTDYDFNKELLKVDYPEKLKILQKNETQLNFNLLFDKEKLKSKLERFFDFMQWEEITWDEFHGDKSKYYYDDIEVKTKYPSVIIDTINFTFDAESINLKDVSDTVDNEEFLFDKIQSYLKDNGNRIKINKEQLKYITEWVNDKIEIANFRNIDYDKEDYNYWLCKKIFFFINKLDIKVTDDKLFEMLFFQNEYLNQDTTSFIDFIQKKVSKPNLHTFIVNELSSTNIGDYAFHLFSKYAISNHLNIVEDLIENYILNPNNSNYYRIDLIKELSKVKNTIPLKKKIITNEIAVEDRHYSLIEHIIESLIIEKTEDNFLINYIKNYFDTNEIKVIKWLIQLNAEEAFDYLDIWLKQNVYGKKTDLHWSISTNSVSTYTNISALKTLFNIFKKAINDSTKQDYLQNLICQTIRSIAYNVSKKEMAKILLRTKKFKTQNFEKDLYFVNELIIDLEGVAIKKISKPYNYREIKFKIQDYL